MRIITFLALLLISANFFSQSSQIDINWEGNEHYNIANMSLIVPKSKDFKNNYSYGDYYRIVKQWESDRIIDESSIEISNIIYSDIDISQFNGLEKINFPKEASFKFNSSISKNLIFSFLELDPIIYEDGKYNKVESFVVTHRYSEKSKNNENLIQSSVMRNGDWYQFFVEESGIHKIDRNFLENLGINTESIDPRKIKIFGHGGEMLSMQNTENFMLDPVENSIKIIGEEDGSFDSNDYILFYASGPNGYSPENNTNLNLYEDKISYFLSVGSEDGLRISDLVEPVGETSFMIDYYTNYQFHEVDDYNLAKIGRRWFGDRFDYENVKTFSFNIDNLIVDQPVNLKVSAAATSEIVTSMSIELNGTQLSTMVFGSIGDPILATGDSFSSNINLNSSDANIKLTYNNNGNPASSAYLDYISIEAISGLNFNGGQLTFYNDNLDYESEIVSYQISNGDNILGVWDISDISNVLEIPHNQESNLAFNRFIHLLISLLHMME